MSIFEGPPKGPSTPSRNRPHGNLNVLRFAVVALFAILGAQLVHMQIIRGEEYARRAELNHITQKDILPVRGIIYDRDGVPLVENVGVFTAVVTPLFLPDPDLDPEADEKRYRIYQRIEEITGTPALQIAERVREAEEEGVEYLEISVAKYLTQEQALMLDEASVDMPGVTLAIKPGRSYPAGAAFGHILGYVGDQTAEERPRLEELGYELNEPVGREGVEAYYESILRGTKGYTQAEQNAEGLLIEALETKQPVPGNNLVLAIDSDLQLFVEELLRNRMAESRAAAAVVMSPKTGEIYAIVSLPNYDNNIFSQPDLHEDELAALNNPNQIVKPLLNQALLPQAPGSTFKLITAAAALQEGNITEHTGWNVPSTVYEFKGETGEIFPLVDWQAHGYLASVQEAIGWSSNIYMYMASCGMPNEGIKGLGKDSETSATVLAYYARAFGLGARAGIDIGGEFAGLVPDPQWKRQAYAGADFQEGDRQWYYADTCFMGIGQYSMTASPLQIARMTAAVANGGTLLTPHVLKSVTAPDGTPVKDAEVNGTKVPVGEEHLATVREGMAWCVTSAACKAAGAANNSAWPMAGKTGTAEFRREDGAYLDHAWFTGYAGPTLDDPEVVVTVYFETGWGGSKAAPVAGEIVEFFAENVTP